MNYLDSAYQWGVNPLNKGNLSQAQMQGLGSLSPTSGIGFSVKQPPPAQLDPYSNLPVPQFGDKGELQKDFDWVDPVAHQQLAATAGMYGPNYDVAIPGLDTPFQAPNLAAQEGKTPYFDPNYPMESMIAERNSLSPQVQQGALQSLNPRGLQYSGLGKYAQDKAQNYLDTTAPNMTSQQAQALDFERLYGPAVANSLIGGARTPSLTGGLDRHQGSLLPGASPFAGGETAGDIGRIDYPGANSGYQFNAPENAPGFGLYNYKTHETLPGPGYTYDPYNQPNPAMMPWLQGAKQQQDINTPEIGPGRPGQLRVL